MKKEFIKTLNSIDYSRNSYEVFSDFLTLASISIANAFYKNPKYEEEYMQTIGRYKKNRELFPLLLGMIAQELERNPFQDLLGDIYMSSEFGNKYAGQFFTPFHVSEMMAKINLGDIKSLFNEYGYFKIGEPAVGSGGFIIAAAKIVKDAGYNPQRCMYFDATDIDVKCFEMTYIQTSLLGLCGDVHLGNTLTLEIQRTYETPMKFADFWQSRFALKKYRKLTEKLSSIYTNHNKAEVIPIKQPQECLKLKII